MALKVFQLLHINIPEVTTLQRKIATFFEEHTSYEFHCVKTHKFSKRLEK